jgi:hypothetical protein
MQKRIARLDAVHQKLVDCVGALEPDLYARSPADGEWSVGEIVHHLCLVEARVFKELERAIAQPPRRVAFLKRLIPTSIVSTRLIRVKAPKAMNPVDAPPRETAIETFNATRNSLKTLCTAHGEERFRNLVFKHPVLGEIDGLATVSFIGHHEARHYKQIREVLRKLGNHQ